MLAAVEFQVDQHRRLLLFTRIMSKLRTVCDEERLNQSDVVETSACEKGGGCIPLEPLARWSHWPLAQSQASRDPLAGLKSTASHKSLYESTLTPFQCTLTKSDRQLAILDSQVASCRGVLTG